jgi:hypothetical protein
MTLGSQSFSDLGHVVADFSRPTDEHFHVAGSLLKYCQNPHPVGRNKRSALRRMVERIRRITLR